MTPDIHVLQTEGSRGILRFSHFEYRCSLGEKGMTGDKKEGDLKTPLGSFPVKECWYRADRIPAPETNLPLREIQPDDGWCDDPKSPHYNQHVKLPFEPSHEELSRDDCKYDIIVTLGYNDRPLIPGKGSAIFLHIAPEGYPATQGCVGLAQEDLLELLSRITPSTLLCIEAEMPVAI